LRISANWLVQHQPNGVSRGLVVAPMLLNIDLQPYQKFQTSNFAFQTSYRGFSDSVFNVISAFFADNVQRFVAEVNAIEL
jgi:60 kDa SS-A/Ro ribonucleoprotein